MCPRKQKESWPRLPLVAEWVKQRPKTAGGMSNLSVWGILIKASCWCPGLGSRHGPLETLSLESWWFLSCFFWPILWWSLEYICYHLEQELIVVLSLWGWIKVRVGPLGLYWHSTALLKATGLDQAGSTWLYSEFLLPCTQLCSSRVLSNFLYYVEATGHMPLIGGSM